MLPSCYEGRQTAFRLASRNYMASAQSLHAPKTLEMAAGLEVRIAEDSKEPNFSESIVHPSNSRKQQALLPCGAHPHPNGKAH